MSTQFDVFGRTINGYDNEIKLYISKCFNIDIQYITDELCNYIETNYYNYWYYCVGELSDTDIWGQWKGIECELKNHALPTLRITECYIQ